MKYNKLLFAFSCLVFFIIISPGAFGRYISLKEAMQKKLVSVDGISNGGYMGKGLTLDLTNHSAEPLSVVVNSGLIFTPEDTSYQNLVALGGELVDIDPYTCNKVKLQTFCGKSYAHSPARGISYQYWRQGDSNMVKTMEYMKQHRITDGLGQSAVWTYTNGHCLSTVYDPGAQTRAKQLIKFIADQRRIPMPKYFTHYELNNAPGATTVINRSTQYVDVHWYNSQGEGNMYVNVYNQNGSLYKQIKGDEVADSKGHTVLVKFNPEIEKGLFYVVVEDDHNNVWVRKQIAVGLDWCQYDVMN